MRFRPCIDIHNGKVKQIIGGSLRDAGDFAEENFVSEKDAAYFAGLYKEKGLSGGHIIILNSVDSPYYKDTVVQAYSALSETPGLLQVGGGITADNAGKFLEAGASHVIVTSYVFSNGRINTDNLNKLIAAVGREHLVLDLSCRKKENDYYIVTDRWQKLTEVKVDEKTLDMLADKCDEFLIHAVDVEGKQSGIETELVELLSKWGKKPMTYAGGIHNKKDIEQIRTYGRGVLDFTVGSALDIFGGDLSLDEVATL